MTAKQIYKNVLIELYKVNAPAIKLYEFNYYCNKAVYQYINTQYSMYDMNQQTTDNLRALQSSVYLTPTKIANADSPVLNGDGTKVYKSTSLYGAAYECWLPMDYLHLLNCICTFEVVKATGCNGEGDCICSAATKLTSDAWSMVMDDVYNRPSPERPYFQIYNQHRENLVDNLPIDPIIDKDEDGNPIKLQGGATTKGLDINGEYKVTSYDSDELAEGYTSYDEEGNPITDPEDERYTGKSGGNFKRTFTFSNGYKESLVERSAAQRISNPTGVRLEIRYGRDTTSYELVQVQVDYLKAPQYIKLTQEQVDLTQDVSQIIEWPDYVCLEIINTIVRLLMERSMDPRLMTNFQMNQTIAPPNGSRTTVAQGGGQ